MIVRSVPHPAVSVASSEQTTAPAIPETVHSPHNVPSNATDISSVPTITGSAPTITLAGAPDPIVNLPFDLVITPATASPGATVTVSYTGDLSSDWLTGIDAYLDQNSGDGWRTTWEMLNESFSRVATSIVEGGPPLTVPAVGVALTAPTTFVLTLRIAPGRYRFCQTDGRTASSISGHESGRVCTDLTVTPVAMLQPAIVNTAATKTSTLWLLRFTSSLTPLRGIWFLHVSESEVAANLRAGLPHSCRIEARTPRRFIQPLR